MLSLFRPKDNHGARIGISVSSDGVAVAAIRRGGPGGRARLEFCRHAARDEQPSATAVFGLYKGTSKQIYRREIY